jgi:hypothetical protein
MLYETILAAIKFGKGTKGDKGATGATGSTGATGPAYTPTALIRIGVGTEYTLTGTSALVAFGTTSPTLLVAAGVTQAMIGYNVSVTATAADVCNFLVYDVEDGAPLAGSASSIVATGNADIVCHVFVAPLVPGHTLQLRGANATTPGGTVEAANTNIFYMN